MNDLLTANNGRNAAPMSAMGDAAVARQANEVQAAMIVAKKFPRDVNASYNRIMQACKRKLLAEKSMYSYPRGGAAVTGPSIRLAEVLAQCWGNIDFGIVELDQRPGASDVMAYAWDLETNSRQVKVFTVKHERHTKKGTTALEDPRDVYEMVANNGARRLRACILGIIPIDIVEAAVEACEKTLSSGHTEPLGDRVRKMLTAFSELGVNQDMLEKRLGHKMDACIESELAGLRKIYTGIKDGFSKREDWFEVAPTSGADKAAEMLGGKADKVEASQESPSEPKASEELRTLLDEQFHRLGMSAKQIAAACESVGGKRVATLRQSQAEKLLDTLQAEVSGE